MSGYDRNDVLRRPPSGSRSAGGLRSQVACARRERAGPARGRGRGRVPARTWCSVWMYSRGIAEATRSSMADEVIQHANAQSCRDRSLQSETLKDHDREQELAARY